MSCTPNAGNSRAGLALAARATCTVERQFGRRRKLGSHAPRPRLIVQPRLGVAAPEEPRHSTWAPTGLPRHLARSAGTALRPLTPASPERDHVAVSVSIALSTFGPTYHRAACCTVPGVLRGATCRRQGLRTPVMCPTTSVTWRLPQHSRKGENLRAVGRSRRSRGASRMGHSGGAQYSCAVSGSRHP